MSHCVSEVLRTGAVGTSYSLAPVFTYGLRPMPLPNPTSKITGDVFKAISPAVYVTALATPVPVKLLNTLIPPKRKVGIL